MITGRVHCISSIALGVTILCAHPATLPAQVDLTQPTSGGGAILGGVIGAGLGFVLGGLVGADLCGRDCGEDEALAGVVVGAALGETLMLPLGVHLGNQRAGSFGLDLLASTAVAGASIALASGGDTGVMLLLGVIGQLATTIWIERKAGANRRPARLAIAFISTPNGRLGLKTSIGI